MSILNSKQLILPTLLMLWAGYIPSSPVASLPVAAAPTLSVQNSRPAPIPPLPKVLPNPRYHKDLDFPEKKAIKSLLQETKLSLGVGQLRPTDLSSFTPAQWEINPLIGTGWLGRVKLPLYTQPGGVLRGWLANGWLLHNSSAKAFQPDKRPFTVESIIYKGTVNSLVVLEIAKDGWFRLRYAEPNSTDDGTAWAHISHLKLSDIALTVEPWEKWFVQQRMLYVQGGRYPIYKQPNSNIKVMTRIGEPGKPNQEQFYTLEALAFKGDWVKVRVKVPAEYCSTPPTASTNSQVYEGWLQWREPQQGSRLWYYSSC